MEYYFEEVGSLDSTIEDTAPEGTVGQIQGQIDSDVVHGKCFVIVEGEDDRLFYERFFESDDICQVFSSKKEDGTMGGNKYLREIVRKFLKGKRTNKVIGISDSDNFVFRPFYRFPKNIFHTDHRDMEMSTLAAEGVKNALDRMNPDISYAFSILMMPLRTFGRLRVCNYLFNLGLNFKRRVRYTTIFDQHSHDLYFDWKTRLYRKVRSELRKNASKGKILTPILYLKYLLAACWFHFCNYSWVKSEDLCQGHDTLSMLSFKLVNNEYSPENLWNVMTNAYNISSFHVSKLYQSIEKWQTKMEVRILK